MACQMEQAVYDEVLTFYLYIYMDNERKSSSFGYKGLKKWNDSLTNFFQRIVTKIYLIYISYMYVCVYLYIYIFMHTYIHIYVCVYYMIDR